MIPAIDLDTARFLFQKCSCTLSMMAIAQEYGNQEDYDVAANEFKTYWQGIDDINLIPAILSQKNESSARLVSEVNWSVKPSKYPPIIFPKIAPVGLSHILKNHEGNV